MVNKLKEILPLLTIVVYGILGIYYWGYYRVFQIDIFQFIEFQELLINGLPILTFCLLATLISAAYVQADVKKMMYSFTKVEEANCESYLWRISLIGFFHLVCFAGLSLILTSIKVKSYYWSSLIYLFHSLFFIIICINLIRYQESIIKVKKVQSLTFLLLCFHLLIFSFGTAGVNASLSTKTKAMKSYSFKYDGAVFDFKTSMTLIGMTNKYVFLFDKTTLSSIILSREKIDSISIRLNRN